MPIARNLATLAEHSLAKQALFATQEHLALQRKIHKAALKATKTSFGTDKLPSDEDRARKFHDHYDYNCQQHPESSELAKLAKKAAKARLAAKRAGQRPVKSLFD